MNRGKLVILFILAVALGAAGFSVWYHYRGQHRALNFWGAGTAMLIADAPNSEALRLGEAGEAEPEEPSEEASEAEAPAGPKSVEFGGTTWKVETSRPAAEAQGLKNLRRALVLDTTFDWTEPAEAEEAHWEYALAFDNGKHGATVLFDFDTRQVALTGGKKTARLEPAASEEFRQFFDEQFRGEAAKPAEGTVPEAEAAQAPVEETGNAASGAPGF